MPEPVIHPASFRDPSGFIFQWEDDYYRQINKIYSEDYDLLLSSGLYDHLVLSGYLIPHTETNDLIASKENWYRTLKPLKIPFITYPYEWCFSQLKDAALLTLKILKASIDHGMIIKDATPYNIQFLDGTLVFIDTLSFEKYDPEKPWVAYRQFCNLFLFPLYLEHYLGTDIQKTLIVYPEGIPVETTSKLLPLKSRTNFGVWLHVDLQNKFSRNIPANNETVKFSTKKMLDLVDHLEVTIQNLEGRKKKSGWSNYYSESVNGQNYLAEKEKIFSQLIGNTDADTVLDLGSNDGYFSKIAAAKGAQVIAIDSDGLSINNFYNELKKSGQKNIIPLVVDAVNPSPATGFQNRERSAFHDRIKTKLVVALALVHHLIIGRNIPIPRLASWLSDISSLLIIEFIPKDDEKTMQMLLGRKDVFHDYTQQNFETIFSRYFNIAQSKPVPGSTRTIYLMEKR